MKRTSSSYIIERRLPVPPTISLRALRSVLSERIRDAGGCSAFAAKHGLTRAAWSNIARGHKSPGPQALAILGYEEIPPRFRRCENNPK